MSLTITRYASIVRLLPINQPSDGGPDDKAEVPQTPRVPIENRNALDGMENMDWLTETILKFDRRTIATLQLIAEALSKDHEFDRAEACCRLALRAIDQYRHGESLRCDVMADLSQILQRQGRFDEAETMLRDAYHRADIHPLTLMTCWGIARSLEKLLEARGKSDEAVVWKERAEVLIRGRIEEAIGKPPRKK